MQEFLNVKKQQHKKYIYKKANTKLKIKET